MEVGVEQGLGDALGAEGVDQQHVAARLGLAQPAHAVGVEHAKAGVVRGHAEMPAQRDHVGVDLHYGQLGRRQVAVAEVRQRAAAEADHADPARARIEQQEGHHRARVGEHERGRVGDVHHALHVAEAEVQRTQAAVLEHEGLAVVARDQAGGERGGVAAGRLEQAHQAGLGGEGAGELEEAVHRIGGGAAGPVRDARGVRPGWRRCGRLQPQSQMPGSSLLRISGYSRASKLGSLPAARWAL